MSKINVRLHSHARMERIYDNLIRIVPEVLQPAFKYRKLEAEGFMPLSVDALSYSAERITIAMAHNVLCPSGDVVPDPDMTVAIYPQQKIAEALSYQDMFGYRQVYHDQDKIDLAAKKDLDAFLDQWCKNLIDQGHR